MEGSDSLNNIKNKVIYFLLLNSHKKKNGKKKSEKLKWKSKVGA